MDNTIELEDLKNEYNKLPLKEKRRELGKEITETMVVIKKLINDSDFAANLEYDNLDEYSNLYQSTTTEDEYLSGLYEDVLNLKEILAIYLSKFE